MKIIAALALTIVVLIVLISSSLLVSRIRPVERLFDIHGDHDLFYRFCSGFLILLLCIFVLMLLVNLFLAVYGIL